MSGNFLRSVGHRGVNGVAFVLFSLRLTGVCSAPPRKEKTMALFSAPWLSMVASEISCTLSSYSLRPKIFTGHKRGCRSWIFVLHHSRRRIFHGTPLSWTSSTIVSNNSSQKVLYNLLSRPTTRNLLGTENSVKSYKIKVYFTFYSF
jgi:hypothetical protein